MKYRDRWHQAIAGHPDTFIVTGGRRALFLERLPKGLIFAGSLLLTGLVAYADYNTGPGISLLLFYLAPIGAAAWYGERWMGLVVAILAATAWVHHELIDQAQAHILIFTWNAFMRVALFGVFAYLLSSLRLRLVQTSIQACTDPLTGLYNRRYLYERIGAELKRAHRHHRSFTLVSIDIDDFKAINDRHGHAAGDAVLTAAGEVLRHDTREIDTAARTGGDEFVVFLIETGAAAGRDVAEKLRVALRARMKALRFPATFSIGVASFERAPADLDDMFRQVDAQLYRAKRLGKDRVVGRRVRGTRPASMG